MNKTTLKARCGSEIRKNWIHHNNDLSLDDLVAKMQRYFDIKDPSNIKLKYRDEEKEWITLADDDDLAFALSTMNQLLYVEVIGVADEDEGEGVITASSDGQEEQKSVKEQKIHREVQAKQSDEKDLSPPTPMSSIGAGELTEIPLNGLGMPPMASKPPASTMDMDAQHWKGSTVQNGPATGMPPPPVSSTPAQQQPAFYGAGGVPPPATAPVYAMSGLPPTAPTPGSGIGELTEIPLNGLGMPPMASKPPVPPMDNQQQQWKGSSMQNGPATGMPPPPISSAPAQQPHQPAYYGSGGMPPSAPVSGMGGPATGMPPPPISSTPSQQHQPAYYGGVGGVPPPSAMGGQAAGMPPPPISSTPSQQQHQPTAYYGGMPPSAPISGMGGPATGGMPPPPISSTPSQQHQPAFYGGVGGGVPPPVSAMSGPPPTATAAVPGSGVGMANPFSRQYR